MAKNSNIFVCSGPFLKLRNAIDAFVDRSRSNFLRNSLFHALGDTADNICKSFRLLPPPHQIGIVRYSYERYRHELSKKSLRGNFLPAESIALMGLARQPCLFDVLMCYHLTTYASSGVDAFYKRMVEQKTPNLAARLSATQPQLAALKASLNAKNTEPWIEDFIVALGDKLQAEKRINDVIKVIQTKAKEIASAEASRTLPLPKEEPRRADVIDIRTGLRHPAA